MIERTRTYDWEDPATALAQGAVLPGIDYVRAIAAGELPAPPIARTLGMGVSEVAEGRAVFTADPAEWLLNPLGIVHAGLALTLLDSAMGCAVHTTLPAGTGYTTLETKGNFVRAIRPDTGRILCEGVVVHRGGRVATAEGRVTSERTGKLLAHGTSTCMVLAPS